MNKRDTQIRSQPYCKKLTTRMLKRGTGIIVSKVMQNTCLTYDIFLKSFKNIAVSRGSDPFDQFYFRLTTVMPISPSPNVPILKDFTCGFVLKYL